MKNRLLAAVTFRAVIGGLVGLTLPMTLQSIRGDRSEEAVTIGVCQAAQNEELFTVDVPKQKEMINKELDRIEEILFVQAKLQEARSSLDVVEHKIDRLRKNLSKEELEAFKQRVDRQRKGIPAKEDSLVNKTMDILHTQGVEASLQYCADLRQHSVSDSKVGAMEKKILEEAPAIKQAQEREQIARVLKILESGQLPDSSFDPYIIRTAQLIIKAHEDSIKRIDDSKRRTEIEEQEKIERVKMEKEMKEKKLEEERLVKQRKEEEKKAALDQAAERKRLAAEEKEKQRQARFDQEQAKQMKAQQEKFRADSLEQQQKKQKVGSAQQKHDSKQEKSIQEQARRDSLEQQKAQKIASDEQQRNVKQEKALIEQARRDSVAQQQKAQKESALEQQRASQVRAQQEMAKNDSLARLSKTQPARADKQVSKQQPEIAPQPVSQAQPRRQPEPQSSKAVTASVSPATSAIPADTQPARPINKAALAYLQSLQDNRKEAQRKVMEIYDLVEQKQGKTALETFKRNREFIGKYIEAQVFNVLEQSVFQSVMETPGASAATSADPAVNSQKTSPEQQRYDKINGFLRDNKVDAAYAEFKRGEKQLKDAMTKDEFKQLKKMVENAYKTRHPNN